MMSADFTSNFWNLYVIVLIVFGVGLCLFVLMTNNKRHTGPVEVQPHVWDETLAEYNNPLPRWWLYLFWATVIFSIVYLAIYPGLGNFQGFLNWSSVGQYEQEMAKAKQKYDTIYAKFRGQGIEALARNAEARAMGGRLFATYCAQCHGADAKGAPGFPNLTDNDWLWGGEPDTIVQTITNGRIGVMTPFDGVLSPTEVTDVANYVRSLSNLPNSAEAAQRGAMVFAANCVVCHGPDGRGQPLLGAPNLTDNIWLVSSSQAQIEKNVREGRNNRMPGFGDFLGEDKVRLLAAYVWGLSNK